MSNFLTNLISRSFRAAPIQPVSIAGPVVAAPVHPPFEDPFAQRPVEIPETRGAEAPARLPRPIEPAVSLSARTTQTELSSTPEFPAAAAALTAYPSSTSASLAAPSPPRPIESAVSPSVGTTQIELASIPGFPAATAALDVYPSGTSAPHALPHPPQAIEPTVSPGDRISQTVLPSSPEFPAATAARGDYPSSTSASQEVLSPTAQVAEALDQKQVLSPIQRGHLTPAAEARTVSSPRSASRPEEVIVRSEHRFISRPLETGLAAQAQSAASLPALERIAKVTRESATTVVPGPTTKPRPSLSLIGRFTPALQAPIRPPEESLRETIVNVSIGRIEVRANQPVGKTEKPKPGHTPPLMGLDEYLRQRSGGKR